MKRFGECEWSGIVLNEKVVIRRKFKEFIMQRFNFFILRCKKSLANLSLYFLEADFSLCILQS